MTDQEIILKREVARLQEQVRLLMLQKQQLEMKVEKMKNCKNCEHYETVEDYGSCRAKCGKIKNGQFTLANWELYKDE